MKGQQAEKQITEAQNPSTIEDLATSPTSSNKETEL